MTSKHTHPLGSRGYYPDHRTTNRKVCRLSIYCRPFTQPECDEFTATVQHISTSGINILAGQPVAAHTLMVKLRNAAGTFSLSKLVRVKHSEPEDIAQCRLGCVFVKKLTSYELAW